LCLMWREACLSVAVPFVAVGSDGAL
jgi:hypothetical protein